MLSAHTTIFFYAGGPEAGNQAIEFRNAESGAGRKAFCRDASQFQEGDVEPCHRVVILPTVSDHQAVKVRAAYARLVEVKRLTWNDVPAPKTADPRPISEPTSMAERLRRMTNRQLRALALGRNIHVDELNDRVALMAAILETESPQPLQSSAG